MITDCEVRILLVHGDSDRLRILERRLNKCDYQVTTCTTLREALQKIHQNEFAFDITLCDANDVAYKFAKLVFLNFGLPTALMSNEASKGERRVYHTGVHQVFKRPIKKSDLRRIEKIVLSNLNARRRSMEEKEKLEAAIVATANTKEQP